jgi:hypothetical protein
VARRIATIGGIALVPGVSKNRRLYTREAIARMVARAQDRIEGSGLFITDDQHPIKVPQDTDPITQLTHHAAEDATENIVGRLTSMRLAADGSAEYTADIADTPKGRVVASLLDTTDGRPPYLKGVSIRGEWAGKVRRERTPEGDVETASDIILHGIDYTKTPGVPGAQVKAFAWANDGASETAETDQRVLITESAPEALVSFTEETPDVPATESAPVLAEGMTAVAETTLGGVREALRGPLGFERGHVLRDGECATCAAHGESATPAISKRDSGLSSTGGPYADPGYQADKKARYQIDTKAHAVAAWAFVNKADNAKAYTPAQLKRVKGRIIKALKKFGVTVAAEGWSIEPAFQVSEAVAEFYGDPSCAGSWSINASNGPVNICLSSYSMDPADLDVILRAAADAACHALSDLDPDMDADIDVPGAGPNSNRPDDAPKETADGLATPDQFRAGLRLPPAATEAAPPVATEPPATNPATETEPDDDLEETTEDPASDPAAAPTTGQEGVAVSEPTNATEAAGQAPAAATTATIPPAAATESAAPGSVTLSGDQFAQLLAAFKPPAPAPVALSTEPAPPQAAAPAAETTKPAETSAPAVTETDDQRIARLVQEGIAAALPAAVTAQVQEMTQQPGGTPSRKGLAAGGAVNEHTAKTTPGTPGLNAHGMPDTFPDKAPYEMSKGEWSHHAGTEMLGYVFGPKGERQQPAA